MWEMDRVRRKQHGERRTKLPDPLCSGRSFLGSLVRPGSVWMLGKVGDTAGLDGNLRLLTVQTISESCNLLTPPCAGLRLSCGRLVLEAK